MFRIPTISTLLILVSLKKTPVLGKPFRERNIYVQNPTARQQDDGQFLPPAQLRRPQEIERRERVEDIGEASKCIHNVDNNQEMLGANSCSGDTRIPQLRQRVCLRPPKDGADQGRDGGDADERVDGPVVITIYVAHDTQQEETDGQFDGPDGPVGDPDGQLRIFDSVNLLVHS